MHKPNKARRPTDSEQTDFNPDLSPQDKRVLEQIKQQAEEDKPVRQPWPSLERTIAGLDKL